MFLTGLRRGCSVRTSCLVPNTQCDYTRSKRRCFTATAAVNNKPVIAPENIVRPPLPTNLPRRIAFGDYTRSKRRCFIATAAVNNKPVVAPENIVRPPLPTNLPRRIAFGI
jgi:hypothetical protein